MYISIDKSVHANVWEKNIALILTIMKCIFEETRLVILVFIV